MRPTVKAALEAAKQNPERLHHRACHRKVTKMPYGIFHVNGKFLFRDQRSGWKPGIVPVATGGDTVLWSDGIRLRQDGHDYLSYSGEMTPMGLMEQFVTWSDGHALHLTVPASWGSPVAQYWEQGVAGTADAWAFENGRIALDKGCLTHRTDESEDDGDYVETYGKWGWLPVVIQ
jgi:hypothetical protein